MSLSHCEIIMYVLFDTIMGVYCLCVVKSDVEIVESSIHY